MTSLWLPEDDDLATDYRARSLDRVDRDIRRMTQPTTPQPTPGWQTSGLGLMLRPFSGLARGGMGALGGMLHGVGFAESFMGFEFIGDEAGALAKQFEAASAALQPENPMFLDRLAEGFGSLAAYALVGAATGGVGGVAARGLGVAGLTARAGLSTARVVGGKEAMVPWLSRVTGVAPFTIVESLAEAGQTFDELKDEGMPQDDAASRAGAVFAQNLLVLGVTNKLGIFGRSGSVMRRAGWAAMFEGLQEGAQYGIQQRAGDKSFDLGQFLEASAIGAIVGGTAGGVGAAAEGQPFRLPSEVAIDSPALRELWNEMRDLLPGEAGALRFGPAAEGGGAVLKGEAGEVLALGDELGLTEKPRFRLTQPDPAPSAELAERGNRAGRELAARMTKEGASRAEINDAVRALKNEMGIPTKAQMAEQKRMGGKLVPIVQVQAGLPITRLDPAEARALLAGRETTPDEATAAAVSIYNDHLATGTPEALAGYDTRRMQAIDTSDPALQAASPQALVAQAATAQELLGNLAHWAGVVGADPAVGVDPAVVGRRMREAFAEFLFVTAAGQLTAMGQAAADGRPLSSAEDRAMVARHKRIQRNALAGLAAVDDRTLATAIRTLTDAQSAEAGGAGIERAFVTGRQFVKELIREGVPLRFEATRMEALANAWVAGLLSNPTTHLVNFAANQAWFATLLTQRALGEVAGRVRRAFTGGEVGIAPGETYQMIASVFGGLTRAKSAAAEVWRAGTGVEGGKTELAAAPIMGTTVFPDSIRDTPVGRGVDYMFTVPGLALESADMVNKSLLEAAELSALIQRQATAATQGITDHAERGEAIERLSAELKNDPGPLRELAKNFALMGTFQNTLGVATPLGSGTTVGGGAAGTLTGAVADLRTTLPGLRFVFTFMRTPYNVMARAMETAAPVHTIAMLRSGDPVKIDTALGQLATTALAYSAVGMLAQQGLITGPGPDDPELKKQWIDGGFQPFSINIGGKWVSYARMEPIGTMIGAAVTLFDTSGHLTDAELERSAMSRVLDTAKLFASRTWTHNVWSMLDTIQDPAPAKAERWLAGQASTLVPMSGALRFLFTDQDKVRAKGFTDELLARLPGGTHADLPADLDLLGNKRYRAAGFGPHADDNPVASWMWNRANALASPWLTTTASPAQQDLFKEFQDNGIRVTVVGDTLDNVKLDGFERNAVQRLAAGQDVELLGRRLAGVRLGGETLEEALRGLVRSEWWAAALPGRMIPTRDEQGAPLASREALVNMTVRRFVRAAQAEYQYGNPVHAEKIRQRAVRALDRSSSLFIQ